MTYIRLKCSSCGHESDEAWHGPSSDPRVDLLYVLALSGSDTQLHSYLVPSEIVLLSKTNPVEATRQLRSAIRSAYGEDAKLYDSDGVNPTPSARCPVCHKSTYNPVFVGIG